MSRISAKIRCLLPDGASCSSSAKRTSHAAMFASVAAMIRTIRSGSILPHAPQSGGGIFATASSRMNFVMARDAQRQPIIHVEPKFRERRKALYVVDVKHYRRAPAL